MTFSNIEVHARETLKMGESRNWQANFPLWLGRDFLYCMHVVYCCILPHSCSGQLWTTEGLSIENLKFAGPEFSNELAFQIALGNVEVFRKQKIDNFDVDVWLQNSAHYLQCTSIWKKADAPILKKQVYNKDSGCAFNIYGTKDINRKTTSIKMNKIKRKKQTLRKS